MLAVMMDLTIQQINLGIQRFNLYSYLVLVENDYTRTYIVYA